MGTGATKFKKKKSQQKDSVPSAATKDISQNPDSQVEAKPKQANINPGEKNLENRPSQQKEGQGQQIDQSGNGSNNTSKIEISNSSGKYGSIPINLKSKKAHRGVCLYVEDIYSDQIYFDDYELRKLKKKFGYLDSQNKGRIQPSQLGYMTEFSSHNFIERIIQLAEDKLAMEGKQTMSFNDFIYILSIFSVKCPVELKIKYLFRVYDVNGDGFVDQRDIKTILRLLFGENDYERVGGHHNSIINDDFVEGMARDMIIMYDMDRDSKLNFREFKNMILESDVETRMNIVF